MQACGHGAREATTMVTIEIRGIPPADLLHLPPFDIKPTLVFEGDGLQALPSLAREG